MDGSGLKASQEQKVPLLEKFTGPPSLSERVLYQGPKRPHKHKDATHHDFRFPACIGPWNQNVRSLCYILLCHMILYYNILYNSIPCYIPFSDPYVYVGLWAPLHDGSALPM